MKIERKFLLVCLFIAFVLFPFSNHASAASVINTLPGHCNDSNVTVQAAGGTFVATETRLKEFTIRTQANDSGHAYEISPIVLSTDASGVPALDAGAVLWTDHVTLSDWMDQEVTFAPDIPLTIGETYFIGLDYGGYGGTATDNWALYCETNNPIQDGQLWSLNELNQWVQNIGDRDIAARIVMTNGDGNLKLFEESFFIYPENSLFLWEPHSTNPETTGSAELGSFVLGNGHTLLNQAIIQENASGIPGKSLRVSQGTSGLNPNLTATVEPSPVGANFNTGRYLIEWTSACTGVSPCDTYIVASGIEFPIFSLHYDADRFLYYYDLDTANFIQIFDLPYPNDTPINFSAVVDYDLRTCTISVPWPASGLTLHATSAIHPSNNGVRKFGVSMSGATAQALAISDIKITKLADDIDADRVEDSVDNCLVDPNPDQGNRDSDGVGDVCDDCPLTAVCPPPPEVIIPTGNVASVSPDGLVDVCFQWPVPAAGDPDYLIKPDCYNVQFELLDSSDNPLQPNCLTPPAYDIGNAVPVSDCYGPVGCCVQCDLKARFPQLPATNSFDGLTFAPIAYESYITDPWVEPTTGACLQQIAGIQGDGSCHDLWIGRIEIGAPSTNNAPTANEDMKSVDEDSGANPIDVLLNDSDPEGDSLTITDKTDGSHGSVTISVDGAVLTYTPNTDYFGSDSFTYTISDGNSGESTATVDVTVEPVNDPPTATNDTASVNEDSGAKTINVLANDSIAPDTGEALTIISKTDGISGTVTITNSGVDLTYTPNADYFGSDSFTYTISDGNGGEATATVVVTIQPVNDPPTANNDSASVDEDSGSNIIDVLANDSISPDTGETLTVIGKTDGAFGGVAITNSGADLTYTPNVLNYTGPDSFFYTISDGNGGQATAEVIIDIQLHYGWGGFFSPIDPDPAIINKVKAGRSIPVKFRLDGDRGLDVLAAPSSVEVKNVGGEVNDIQNAIAELSETAGKSSITYDPVVDIYTYVWKTSKNWAGQYRQLHVNLNDGQVYTATFMFAK